MFLVGHTPSGAPEGRVSAKGIHDLSGCVGEASFDSLASISNWTTLKISGQRLHAQIGVVEDPLQSHSRCRCLAHKRLGSPGGPAWVYRDYVQTIFGLDMKSHLINTDSHGLGNEVAHGFSEHRLIPRAMELPVCRSILKIRAS